MARTSKIKRLPKEIRDEIGRLRENGRTLQEILAKLRELSVDVSQTTLWRHVKQLDAIGEELRRTRTVAEALVQRFGDAPESKTARLNIELTHALIMKLLVGEDGTVVKLDPKEAMFAATALQKLSQASKQDVEREVKIRKELANKVADGAEKVAKEVAEKHGFKLPPEALRAIREQVYGIVESK